MTDMLVKLYKLPPLDLEAQRASGVVVRRAMPAEKLLTLDWIGAHFYPAWVSECDVAFSHVPIGCFLAVQNRTLLGFACYDATNRGCFGPTGVAETARGRGIGRALLLACLHDMRAQGYGYAIIAWIGPREFYEKTVGATVIEDSSPGVYDGVLTGQPE